ncbi:hypothetical protein [Flavobacterium sp. 140616W15]|uniref:hypothetical protein n=1 Tax=Flavobacterium sp. 140616W15 TaxID=2478552 RepID=UPI000F0CE58F|nr:hypothetical protein [Flavobacterium sp. 140616W15]AYN05147.1 hypothetical protein EAG11_14060 [Flavobacterium sp. 140616W15]
MYIDKIDSLDDIHITRSESFTESINLSNGIYTIIISGKNPQGGETIMSFFGTDSTGKEFNYKKT